MLGFPHMLRETRRFGNVRLWSVIHAASEARLAGPSARQDWSNHDGCVPHSMAVCLSHFWCEAWLTRTSKRPSQCVFKGVERTAGAILQQ